MPQPGMQVPFWHCWPEGHFTVSLHCAHLCALQACSSLPAPPHCLQSASAPHSFGHFGEQLPSMQMSDFKQCDVSVAVQAPHFPPLHTWCAGSHALQSASALQVMTGVPWESLSHVWPSGTQRPKGEQSSPVAQPLPETGSHATQRFSSTRHLLRPSVQPPHSASLLHELSKQMPLPVLPPEPEVAVGVSVASLEHACRSNEGAAKAMTASANSFTSFIGGLRVPAERHGPIETLAPQSVREAYTNRHIVSSKSSSLAGIPPCAAASVGATVRWLGGALRISLGRSSG